MSIQTFSYPGLEFWNDIRGLQERISGIIDSFKTSKEITTQTWATSLFGTNQPLPPGASSLNLDVLAAQRTQKASPAMQYTKTRKYEHKKGQTHGYLPIPWKVGLADITLTEALTWGRVPGTQYNNPDWVRSTNLGYSTLKAVNSIKLGLEDQAIKTIFYGEYDPSSVNFSSDPYDFGKDLSINTEAKLLAAQTNHNAINVDLKTLNANGGVGKRAWDTTGGTVSARNILQDIRYQYEAYRRANRRNDAIILMSEDTYAVFEAYLLANRETLSNEFFANVMDWQQKNIEQAREFEGLVLQRYMPFTFGGLSVSTQLPIYTYSAFYHDDTGALKNMVPNGYCVILPPPGDRSPLLRRYGQIEHELLRDQQGNYAVEELAVIPQFGEFMDRRIIGNDMLASTYMISTNMDLISCWKVLNVAD